MRQSRSDAPDEETVPMCSVPAKPPGHRLQLLLGALGQLQDALGALIEHLARLGQLHAARPALQKLPGASSSSNSLS